MKRRLAILAGVCALASSFVLVGFAAPQKPANVAGVWVLTLGGQSRSLTLTFTQDGAKIKGTMAPPNVKGGTPIAGAVDGNKVTFATPTPPPGGKSIEEKFAGTVNGETMTGTVEVVGKGFTGLQSFMNMDRYVPWTAKRQK